MLIHPDSLCLVLYPNPTLTVSYTPSPFGPESVSLQNATTCERRDKGAMARGHGYSWEQKVSSGTLSQTRDRRDIEISWTVYYEGSRLADKVNYCGIYT